MPSPFLSQLALLMLSVVVVFATSASGELECGDDAEVLVQISWRQTHENSCGEEFTHLVEVDQLLAVEYPERALFVGLGATVEFIATVSETGEITDVVTVRSSVDFLLEAARQALVGSRFRPADIDGRPVPSTVEVSYRFCPEFEPARPVSEFPNDEELERRAGRQLSKTAIEFIEAADSFEFFELYRKNFPVHRIRKDQCFWRGIDFKESAERGFKYYVLFGPVQMAEDDVEEFKHMFIGQSPYWVASYSDPSENLDIRFAGFSFGYRYGVCVRKGDEEMFVMANPSRSGSIRFANGLEYFGGGHPYRRTTDYWCRLAQKFAGRVCIGDEW